MHRAHEFAQQSTMCPGYLPIVLHLADFYEFHILLQGGSIDVSLHGEFIGLPGGGGERSLT
jgi:hypothetical protein